MDARHYTTAAALGTVMGKVFGLRSPHSSALLDRCPTFVSKDKSLKAKLIGKTRKVHNVVICVGRFTVNPLTFAICVIKFMCTPAGCVHILLDH